MLFCLKIDAERRPEGLGALRGWCCGLVAIDKRQGVARVAFAKKRSLFCRYPFFSVAPMGGDSEMSGRGSDGYHGDCEMIFHILFGQPVRECFLHGSASSDIKAL